MRKNISVSLLFYIIFSVFIHNISYAGNITDNKNNQLLQNKLSHLSSNNIRFTYNDKDRVSFLIVGKDFFIEQPYNGTVSSEAEASAINFLTEYSGLFGTNYKPEYSLIKNTELDRGHVIKLRQTFGGIPVFAGEMVVRMNKSFQVTGVNGEVSSDLASLSLKPKLTPEDAMKEALSFVTKKNQIGTPSLESNAPSLWIYNPSLIGKGLDINTLVWRLDITNIGNDDTIREFVMVDAITGEILLNFNRIMHVKDRNVYDNENTPNSSLPGNSIARAEGDGPVNIDVDTAYDYSGDTYDFYFTHHNRDSLDNNGVTMTSTVRHCPPGESCPYQNAFWNGSQMAYGNGFSAADDVVGHELTHAVTEYTSNLVYLNQSGAINESFSDVWGEFVDLTNTGGTDTAAVRWQMGEDVPAFGAIRDMAHPENFNDPDKVTSSNYYCGSADNGGVHTNSGVNNKAAYLMADGDTFNNISVVGIGITKTAKIYYEAQTHILTSGSTYQNLYTALQVSCTTLIGTDGITSADCNSVKDALDAVEMNVPPCAIPPAPVCPANTTANDIFADDLESGLSSWMHAANEGIDVWSLDTAPSGGNNFIHGDDIGSLSDSYIGNVTAINLPADAYLRFDHFYDLEASYDGGVIEYSLDNGTTWVDAGSLITENGYTGTLSANYNNPLGGRAAFEGSSMGAYTSSRLNLSSLAGSALKFRFRIGTDTSVSKPGWDIDNVRVYTCDTASILPEVTSPTAGSTLTDTSATFSWAANSTAVSEWWLYVGTSLGAFDILNSGSLGLATSHTVTGLPNDGSAIFLRLWYKEDGSWKFIDTTYTSVTQALPEITAPTAGSKLSASTLFEWTNNNTTVSEWWLYIGTSLGANDIIDSGSLGVATSYAATGIPINGGDVYVRLWYKEDGTWKYIDGIYTTEPIPEIITPVAGSTLSDTTAVFEWTSSNAVVSEWWLYIGTSQGEKDIIDTGSLGTATTYAATGLPSNGGTIFVRLWYKESGIWKYVDTSYFAYTGFVTN